MQILLFLTISATFISLVLGSWDMADTVCYHCVEGPDLLPGLKKCIYPFTEDDSNQKCHDEAFCMKGIGTFEGHTIVMRQCIPLMDVPNFSVSNYSEPPEPVEMNIGGVKVIAHICSDDLCNAATIPKSQISLAILFFSVLLLL